MNQTPRGHRRPLPDTRAPEEKALWEQIRTELARKRHDDKLPPTENLPDLWLFDSEHLLQELGGLREMILRVPETLKTRSALQSAVDRIWRLEQDLRSLLHLHREGQRSFATKAAKIANAAENAKPTVRISAIQSNP